MTRRTHRLTLLLGGALLLAATSCSKTVDKPVPAAPVAKSTEITADLKKGMGLDLVFAITAQDITADGSRVLQVRGTHKGVEVGLIVVLGPKWESVAPESGSKSKFVFHTGIVEYRTIGEPSNALLTALDELYGTKLDPKAMRQEAKFNGISLQGDPADLAKGELRLKLTSEASDPARQAELYTNIDLSKHELRIAEKDAGFRKAVIQALTKE